MTTRNQVTAMFARFAGQSATLVIPRPYIDLCEGDHLAALLLSQILYWTERTDNPEGWFAKSYEDWYDELALTDKQIKRIVSGDKRRKDKTFSLDTIGVETKLARSKYYDGAATLHYRINYDVLEAKIAKFSQVSPIAGNPHCGKPPIAENDDPPIAENDHIHRLDHKEKTTANAVLDDFKAIQEHAVNVVYGGNAKKWGAAGDLANWALCGSTKTQWLKMHPDAPFTLDEWKAFLLWYLDKGIAWPANPEKWNGQAYEFRHDARAHRSYMARIAPQPEITPVSDDELAQTLRDMGITA